MPKIYRIISYLVFGLNGLLILFWVYLDKLVIPVPLQTLGRMHPMVLHLPIGFFVIAVLILVLKSQFKPKAYKSSLQFIFALTALSSVATALAGIMLSREGGYDDETLKGHLNSGMILSLVSAFVAGTTFQKKVSNLQYGLIGIGFLLLVVTGHYGATLTHGEDYLLGPMKDKEGNTTLSEDSLTVFTKAVLPVLEKKCTSCHNSKKKKGELILTNQHDILKGGENGVVINASNPEESELLKRVHLDLEHDDHMPPSGKPQLTKLEKDLLNKWISGGADFTSLWKKLSDSDSLVVLTSQVLMAYEKPKGKAYDFDFVSIGEIELLNSPFRTVSQVSIDLPALKASYYLAQYFSPGDLKPLESIKSQLVELNLAGMPITDKDADYIAEFINLEYLNLNNTKVSDPGITKLARLEKLSKISIAGTKVTSNGLHKLSDLKSLKEVYLWNTSISNDELNSLRSRNSKIVWNTGFQPDKNEILKLTPPILINEFFLLKANDRISLKHNLPGTTIRFTLDGTEPDSINSVVYSKPIEIKDHTKLRTLATKDGWLKSNTLEYNFYLEGIEPIQTELLTATNKDFKAKGATSLSDKQIGDVDNFRDGNWLGFRENKIISQFTFNESEIPKKVTLIYNKNIGSYLMPPESVEIWGGNNNSELKLLTKIKPEQPVKYSPTKSESISYQFEGPFRIIKIIAIPAPKLPAWHSGKGEKGWLMVSEIIFR